MRTRSSIRSIACALLAGLGLALGCGGGEPRAKTPEPADVPLPALPSAEPSTSAAPSASAPA